MAQIGLSYTSSSEGSYNFVLDNFGGNELSRTYSGQAAFSYSVGGSSIINGPAFRQKFVWSISSVVTRQEAIEFDKMFRAWDADRAIGLASAVGVTDTCFGDTVEGDAVFSVPPSYTRMGPVHTMISFGLSEV